MELAVMGFFAVLILVFIVLTIVVQVDILRAFFFLIAFSFALIALNLGRLFAELNGMSTSIIKMLDTSYIAILWITITFAFLFFIYGLYKLFIGMKELLKNKRQMNFELK